jgi:hypothetical protein
VRIFKNTWFTRFARREGIADDELREAVNQIEADQFDADLGGGVYKQRISREGEGKSGGYRVIVLFKSGDRSFFVYGFAKSDRGNIDQKEMKNFKEYAKDYLGLSVKTLDEAVKKGKFIEV